jgi:hypothetical protein
LPNTGTYQSYHTSLVGILHTLIDCTVFDRKQTQRQVWRTDYTRNRAKTIFNVKSLWPGLVVDTRYNCFATSLFPKNKIITKKKLIKNMN